jgi:hypothetical protein
MILASHSRSLSASLLSAALIVAATPASAQQTQQPRTTRPPATPASPAKPAQARPGQATSAPATPATQQARPGAASNPQRPAAQQKPAAAAAAPAAGPGGSAASLVASFGDWSVYTAQAGRSKICYAITQPKDRLPKGLSRDPAYLFVSFRPAENVKNEVALVLGFKTKEDGTAEAAIGTASYALLPKDQNAWLKNPAEEGQAITSMTKGQSFVVKVQSQRGNQLTDRYSLSGFGQALERARKECP